MDKLHSYRQPIKDDIDPRQASILLTELEGVEDRARRMLGSE